MMNHIFITGATGVLGSALIPILLQSSNCTLHLLIRGTDDQHVATRLQDLRSFCGADVADQDWKRCIAYRGDASLSQFGLGDDQYQSLLGTITHIVHCAAAVRLDMTMEEAVRSVLMPSHMVHTFAKTLHTQSRLKKFEYISTLGVAGRMRGNICETELPDRTFHNTYEQTKSMAEQAIVASQKEGMPVTIHRPSMVIGDSRTGKVIHFQGFYFLVKFLSGQKTMGFLPNVKGHALDLIASDDAARIIAWSLNTNKTTGKILHICAGPDHAVPYTDLIHLIQRYRIQHNLPVRRIILVPPSLFLTCLGLVALLTFSRRHLRDVYHLGLYYRHLKTVQVFENQNTTTYLSAAGLTIQAPADYLGRVLDFWMTSRASHSSAKKREIQPRTGTECITP